jgi:hypothetical protein
LVTSTVAALAAAASAEAATSAAGVIFYAEAGSVKGKCALGPFLCILVIECQHMCLIGNLCTWMNKVKIMK